ncbi:MAG: hypothetical protein NE330_15470 [Lentisphaeraceae bacterium]|nr:hypothetical protein [Lentisphaeraceae bacterium]
MKKDTIIHLVTISGIVILAGLYSTQKNEVKASEAVTQKVDNSHQLKLNEKSLEQDLKAKELELKNLQKRLDSREEKIAELTRKNAEQKELQDQQNKQKANSAKKVNELVSNLVNPNNKALMRTYGDLIEKLGLEGEEKSEFLKMAHNYQKAYLKQFIKLMKEDGTKVANFNEYNDVMAGTKEEEALKGFLGEDYELFEHNRKSAIDRRTADNINNKLGEDSKLSSDQKNQLVDLLHNRSQEKYNDPDATDDIYLETAQEFLSHEQYEALEKQFKFENNRQSITVNGKKTTIPSGTQIIVTP